MPGGHPYQPIPPSPNMSGGGNYAVNQSQQEVDEVMGIMQNNIQRVIERDTKLTDINQRADQLQDGASQFKTTGQQLRRKMWWQNMKFKIVIAVIVIVILGVFIGVIVAQTKKKN
eukprot:sb/3476752/